MEGGAGGRPSSSRRCPWFAEGMADIVAGTGDPSRLGLRDALQWALATIEQLTCAPSVHPYDIDRRSEYVGDGGAMRSSRDSQRTHVGVRWFLRSWANRRGPRRRGGGMCQHLPKIADLERARRTRAILSSGACGGAIFLARPSRHGEQMSSSNGSVLPCISHRPVARMRARQRLKRP